MARDYLEFVLRRPRHESNGHEVEVRQSGNSPADAIKAELVNFSRDGIQIRMPFPLREQKCITIRLRDKASGIDLELLGVVRWQRPEEANTWLVGCRHFGTLDLETLGEMFLNGILSMEGCWSADMHVDDSEAKSPSSDRRE